MLSKKKEAGRTKSSSLMRVAANTRSSYLRICKSWNNNRSQLKQRLRTGMVLTITRIRIMGTKFFRILFSIQLRAFIKSWKSIINRLIQLITQVSQQRREHLLREMESWQSILLWTMSTKFILPRSRIRNSGISIKKKSWMKQWMRSRLRNYNIVTALSRTTFIFEN